MPADQNSTARQDGKPVGRLVRSLLGLPEGAAGDQLRGQGPLPPVAFRYQTPPVATEPCSRWPVAGRTAGDSAGGGGANSWQGQEEEAPPWSMAPAPPDRRIMPPEARPAAAPPPPARVGQTEQQADRPLRREPEERPPAPRQAMDPGGGQRSPAAPRPFPPLAEGGSAAGTASGKQPQPAAPAMPAAAGEQRARRAAPDDRPPAGQTNKPAAASGPEIAIPGRSSGRQVFTALTPARGDLRPAPGPLTDVVQPSPALRTGQQAGDGRTAVHQNGPSAASGPEPQATASAAAAARTADAAPPQRPGRLWGGTAAPPAGRGTANTAAAPQPPPDTVSRQRREEPRSEPRTAGHQPAAATPARRADEDSARQIEELRRTFYELMHQKSKEAPRDSRQPGPAGPETPPPPPQQVVVINRTAGGASRGRSPAAFWERSCMTRVTLKMIR